MDEPVVISVVGKMRSQIYWEGEGWYELSRADGNTWEYKHVGEQRKTGCHFISEANFALVKKLAIPVEPITYQRFKWGGVWHVRRLFWHGPGWYEIVHRWVNLQQMLDVEYVGPDHTHGGFYVSEAFLDMAKDWAERMSSNV